MKVSIIVPVYNVAPYIRRCLESVVAQSHQELECILVDDCSTDDSVGVAVDFLQRTPSHVAFKWVHHVQNAGQSAARNSGIKAATGQFVYFLDSDDALTPNCIATLVALAEKHPDIDFAQGNLLAEDGSISRYGFNFQMPEYVADSETLSYYLLSRLTTSACNRLLRRQLLVDHRLFFPVGMVHEDMYWCYFLAKHVKAAAFTGEGLYIYYTNANSTMTSVSGEKRIRRYESRLRATEAYLADMSHSRHTTPSQRQYVAVNLLSCLTELMPLGSLHHWLHFWHALTALAFRYSRHFAPWRALFLATLFPPFCFVAGKDRFRWRIQQSVVPRL